MTPPATSFPPPRPDPIRRIGFACALIDALSDEDFALVVRHVDQKHAEAPGPAESWSRILVGMRQLRVALMHDTQDHWRFLPV